MKGIKKVLIGVVALFVAFVVLAVAGAMMDGGESSEDAATTEAAAEITTEAAAEDASTAETESAEDAKKAAQKEVEDKYGLMKLADPQNDNTMSSVRRMGDVLDVTVRQYNKGEEHYAQQLFGGDVYAEYWVHIDTGEIEKIDAE